MTNNEKAFLDMIAWAELGHSMMSGPGKGYNVLVGSLPGRVKTFSDYSDHPRILVKLNAKLSSTAAGRYQILRGTFDAYKKRLNLPDFSPDSQDKIALRLIEERGAKQDVINGDVLAAVAKIAKIWASLPGAGYGQPERKKRELEEVFVNFGGTLRS